MKNFSQLWKDVSGELSRVTWPTFPEFVRATIVVLVIVVLAAVYFGIIDYQLLWLQRQVL
jgi:preprotein translocase SecE subunit